MSGGRLFSGRRRFPDIARVVVQNPPDQRMRHETPDGSGLYGDMVHTA
ncbi:hypothetical protein GLUCOINTEAF2_0202168 [Komagataeibacter intermedius AF2]|uniref:Uncharacterized protein n=1 Tax=Komagataeibacter intermedius AF2 TaxID=1458464 RepID=A0A0N1FLM7_9PROT|nr:hypothetical protein GLUCOINTEAF2_0202168 [Komagataeibacter intermedius AF2]